MRHFDASHKGTCIFFSHFSSYSSLSLIPTVHLLDFIEGESDAPNVRPMDKLKLLGVLFDRNLLFSNHISTVCKKAGMRVAS